MDRKKPRATSATPSGLSARKPSVTNKNAIYKRSGARKLLDRPLRQLYHVLTVCA